MKHRFTLLTILSITICWLTNSCSSNLNPVYDEHFDKEGHILPDYKDSFAFEPCVPSTIKFYVEVSGSMNGFFRANRPTHFKTDVWEILSYYSLLAQDITVLTNNGSRGETLSHKDFQTKMNTGQFISTASTKVPLMLQSIIENLDTDAGEVAVLISDMKYSPVGNAAPKVLMTQYSTDISQTLGEFGQAVCLIGATSNYVDKTGNDVCERSPYYYLILGSAPQVAYMRNGISTLLDNNHHFFDNIESGFEYSHPNYEFGNSYRCEQFDEEPTFYNYEEPSEDDTCTINLNVHLENYRWLLANEEIFRESFTATALHGSEIRIGDIHVEVQNINDKVLKRKAMATIELQVLHMPLESDVIEWTLHLLDTDTRLMDEFLVGADAEEDVTKSYSVKDFIKGMFYGGIINRDIPSNYILITKNS